MLLYGVPGADIQLQDTLLHPMHRDAGELERFNRVIANPPFSQNTRRATWSFLSASVEAGRQRRKKGRLDCA
jgi:type I restriction enzyme M protein